MTKYLTFVIFLALFIGNSLNSEAQWYQNNFGVDSVSQLSEQQYSDALQLADKRINSGIILGKTGLGTMAAGFAVLGGTFLYLNFDQSYNNLEPVIISALIGIILSYVAFIPIAVGLPTWFSGKAIKKDLLNVFGENGIQVSLIPSMNYFQNRVSFGPKIILRLY